MSDISLKWKKSSIDLVGRSSDCAITFKEMPIFCLLSEKNEKENLPEWEQELQRELQEYELVNQPDIDDADLENEIMKQIEEESVAS